jgi:hypothetical protein
MKREPTTAELKTEISELYAALDEIWGGQRMIYRIASAWLCGDEKQMDQVLVVASARGHMKYDIELTKRTGGRDNLIRTQENLNAHYKPNPVLQRFLDRLEEHKKGLALEAAKPAPAKNDEPEMGR